MRRAACIELELERLEALFAEAGGASEHKIEVYSRLANNLRRLLETLGLARRIKDVTPTLGQILREGMERHD